MSRAPRPHPIHPARSAGKHSSPRKKTGRRGFVVPCNPRKIDVEIAASVRNGREGTVRMHPARHFGFFIHDPMGVTSRSLTSTLPQCDVHTLLRLPTGQSSLFTTRSAEGQFKRDPYPARALPSNKFTCFDPDISAKYDYHIIRERRERT